MHGDVTFHYPSDELPEETRVFNVPKINTCTFVAVKLVILKICGLTYGINCIVLNNIGKSFSTILWTKTLLIHF